MDTIMGLPAGKFIFEGIKTGISVIDLMSKKNEREHEHKLLINAIKKEDRPPMYYPAPQGYYYQPAPPPQQPVYYAPAPQPAYYQAPPPAPAPAYQQGGYYSGYYSQPAPPPAPTYQAPPVQQPPQYGQPYYGYGYYGGSPSMSWLDRQREEAQWKSDYYKLQRENEDLRHECAYARAEGVLSAKRNLLPPPQTQQTPPVVINQPEINLDQLSTLTAQKLYDMHNKPDPENP